MVPRAKSEALVSITAVLVGSKWYRTGAEINAFFNISKAVVISSVQVYDLGSLAVEDISGLTIKEKFRIKRR